MAILEKLYEQYIAGELDIKPKSITSDIHAELEKSKYILPKSLWSL